MLSEFNGMFYKNYTHTETARTQNAMDAMRMASKTILSNLQFY